MDAPAEIFREYDIRGLVEQQLTPELAYHLGSAVVGRDHRESGEALADAVARGLSECGLAVSEIGITPTPVGYWAIHHLEAGGGLHVTGSHNPPEYNGFKITLRSGPVYGDDIRALRARIVAEDYASGTGARRDVPVLDAYLDALAENLEAATTPLKVVVDAGNGTAGLTAVPLYERLGHSVVPLYCEPDPEFPNHHPDPTVEENLDDLKRAVDAHGAQLGLAFDGDGDRVGVIDADGSVVWGDRLLILLAREVLREQPGAAIIGEVKCSKALYDDIEQHGGRAIMWRAGHSLIKAKMKAESAALAGEMSGHIFYQHRYYGFDDAVYAGGRLLEVLARHTATVGELLSDVPEWVATPEIRMECPEAIKFELVRRVAESFKAQAQQEGFRVVDIDGARLEWEDGWGLVRPSNTQPLLVLRFEAKTQARVDAIRERMMGEINRLRHQLEQ